MASVDRPGKDDEVIVRTPFGPNDIAILNRSIEIAEELVSDHFKISTSEWKRYRYDIQTLAHLNDAEVTDLAFAQIRRYLRCPDQRLRGSNPGDFFKICLQDHIIRRALSRDDAIALLPLGLYIMTHELIHVIRFTRFLQSFDTSEAEREAEEKRVHSQTYNLLHHCKVAGIGEVLGAFGDCRTMETFLGSQE
ncbi:MAG: hypothetical protein AB9873_00310 [Syntrophobacteraceae bacterium]